jgi:hypothetical protein
MHSRLLLRLCGVIGGRIGTEHCVVLLFCLDYCVSLIKS